EPLAESHRRLKARATYYAAASRVALSHLERSLFEEDRQRADPGTAVRLLEGGGERAELELVAREIDELLRGGMAAEEIAVVMRSPADSADLLEEVFVAARVPFALQRRRRFADTALGRALVGMLRCVRVADAASAGSAGDLLAWLRA